LSTAQNDNGFFESAFVTEVGLTFREASEY
jgi:hypothetical protein